MRTPRKETDAAVWGLAGLALCGWIGTVDVSMAAGEAPTFRLQVRRQVAEPASGDGPAGWRAVEEVWDWDARKTAVVVCDMWDQHWCRGATARVAAMAPRMNAVLQAARARGALILHCPSDTLKFYEGTPARELARSAPASPLRVPVTGWCGLDPAQEAALPIDDADGGCDDEPRCPQGSPWRRQIAALEILPGDAVTDSIEAVHLMNQRGIEHVVVMGVHLNMCVLGRPFGIRQLVRQGKRVVLVRDLTDTMYNSRQRPQVSHFAGTELMVGHVERYWCATVTSADFVGGQAFRFAADTRPRVVVMIGEDEYRTWETLPRFVADELMPRGFSVAVCREDPSDPGRFPGLDRALEDSDLVVVSVRRRAVPSGELAVLRRHLEAGRGLVGIRTASHAFAPRGADRNRLAGGQLGEWPEFDPDVLGGNYQGHHGVGPVTRVSAVAGAEAHPMLQGIDLTGFESRASLYKTSPLKSGVTVLLEGTIPGQTPEPLAWTRTFGPRGARVFYTSLGSPDDFREPRFRRLLANGIRWAADRD